jgi:hypothetical protein
LLASSTLDSLRLQSKRNDGAPPHSPCSDRNGVYVPDRLGKLRRRFTALCKQAAVKSRFFSTPQHDGTAHVEVAGGVFFYVVTERGAEIELILVKHPFDDRTEG